MNWPHECQVFLSINISLRLLKLMFIESLMPSSLPIFCHPLLLLQSIFPSIRVFSNESALRIRWPKYWSFSFSISPSSEYSGLISFRINLFDLPEDQGTLKSLLQHHSSKALILWLSAFFIVQLSCKYMTTGETIAVAIKTFVGKVMFLLFNMLSRFVIAFLPRSKHLLISCCSHHPQWFWSQRKWSFSLFPLYPHLFAMKWWDQMPLSSFFECWVFSQLFHSPVSLSSRGSLVPLRFLPLKWYHLHIWGCWYFSWITISNWEKRERQRYICVMQKIENLPFKKFIVTENIFVRFSFLCAINITLMGMFRMSSRGIS